ncbi:MAG: phospho-N-acetylmuramoyl-pentapeptide-transferase [Muribaculaceae bacterium]|nr:phospho-N-acetylmuramoyl-pentapeptide-transferase [Muribaculaceae bacterium]MBR5437253.1 phospho-N-acetylmuramoyl-pentapeptide-transferase [Muribaculaceae bacterium]
MLYHLFEALKDYDIPGARLMTYITFRASVALVLSIFVATYFGRRIINKLQRMQIGEVVRDLGMADQMQKKGTPTMGGIIIILAIMVPCLLIGKLNNVYMILMLVSTMWLGTIGFLDDYRKFKFRNKAGLKGKYKIFGQVGLGLIVGLTMYLSPDVVIRENRAVEHPEGNKTEITYEKEDIKTTQTTIPFVKNNNFDYSVLTGWLGKYAQTGGWILFILIVILAVTATSNGANLTDGLDGLATGTSAIIGVALAIMAYLGGHIVYASYLNIMFVPQSAELVVYMAAFIGALIGFLWYNAYPAQVFMGDTGSLTLGGVIAVFAILIHKELLIPILCALFFLEDISVMLQVAYFKLTKKKYGEGRRIFKMTPLHHHFQNAGNESIKAKLNWPNQSMPESRIVIRFWIISILLAALTFATLKIR